MTIREIIAEQRRRLRSPNAAQRLAAALLLPNLLRERLNELDDAHVGQLLEDEVWSNLNLAAPESTVCLVAADRLRGHVNASADRKRFGTRRRARRSWKEWDDGMHILNAESALYGAGIACLALPFQQNRFASNVFMVPSVPEAKACLCHAGFRETPRSLTLMVDIQTGRPIRLYEDRS